MATTRTSKTVGLMSKQFCSFVTIFSERRIHRTTKFFELVLDAVPLIPSKGAEYIWQTERAGINAMALKRAWVHLISDVFAAFAFLSLKLLIIISFVTKLLCLPWLYLLNVFEKIYLSICRVNTNGVCWELRYGPACYISSILTVCWQPASFSW